MIRYCDTCKFAKYIIKNDYPNNEDQVVMRCQQGYKPRFKRPEKDNPYDSNWGWRRMCDDYEGKI